jgi:hypothetical protein
MSGSNVFAALILARAVAGPEPVRDAPPKSYAPRMTAT